jgi:hypothetical protein
VPSVLVGFWALRHLTDKPIEADWLEPDERIALQARIDHERKSREAIRHYKLGEALANPRVLGLSLVLFGILCGQYSLVYWLPQIVKGVATKIGLDKATGISINALTGYLVAVPFAFATVAMIWWTRHSDVTHERVWHVFFPAVASGLALIASAYLSNPILLRDGSIFGPKHLLDPPNRLSHRLRCRWRHCIDKFDRQPRRLCRPVCHWLDQGCDRRNNAWACRFSNRSDHGRIVTFLMGHDSKIEMAGSRIQADCGIEL